MVHLKLFSCIALAFRLVACLLSEDCWVAWPRTYIIQ